MRIPLATGLLLTATIGVHAQLPPAPVGETAEHGPRLFVAERIKDLGTIIEGDRVSITWTLENRGDANLEIERTAAACGCTVVQLSDAEKVIPPGKSLELKAQFDSTSRREDQVKTVNVYSNDRAEPDLKLEFRAKVDFLFELDPPNLVSLRTVRRGVPAAKALDVYPGPGRSNLTIRDLQVLDDAPLAVTFQPFKGIKGAGQRVTITVLETASLGTINGSVKLKLDVDGVERERTLAVRGEVIADLSWLPKVVDATRQTSLPGKKFAPITVTAAEKSPFEITKVEAGPWLETSIEPGKKPESKTEYNVSVALKADAPPGPFGAMIRIHTTSLDQPLLEVPLFGIVAPPVEIDPPSILFRVDGTPAGTNRRVKLQASSPSQSLEIKSISCDNPAVVARVDKESASRYVHIRFLDVNYSGEAPATRQQAILRVETTPAGAERIEIPVTIEGKNAASRN